MIRELLIGTAVIGGGGYYVASTYSSADVVRTVNASPHDTWRGFDLVFNEYAAGMGTLLDQPGADRAQVLRPVVTSTDSKELDFRLDREGTQLVRIRFQFEPLSDGAQTRLRINAEVNNKALPGDSSADIGRRVMFKQMLGRLADEMIKGIESGKLVQFAEVMAEARREYEADPRTAERKFRTEQYRREQAQAAASAPMLDPDQAKVNPVGAAVVPSSARPAR